MSTRLCPFRRIRSTANHCDLNRRRRIRPMIYQRLALLQGRCSRNGGLSPNLGACSVFLRSRGRCFLHEVTPVAASSPRSRQDASRARLAAGRFNCPRGDLHMLRGGLRMPSEGRGMAAQPGRRPPSPDSRRLALAGAPRRTQSTSARSASPEPGSRPAAAQACGARTRPSR